MFHLLFMFFSLLQADEATIPTVGKFTFKPYGFVATDLHYDTRQVYGFRDDFVVVWPQPILYDRFCQDINAHGIWNLTPCYTRLGLEMSHPWCTPDTEVKAVIEGDFLGLSDLWIDDYRLRYAFIQLASPSFRILLGQWWHPLFLLDCFPDTIGFSNGAPMEPQAREPQLRMTYFNKSLECNLTVASQRDFNSDGPFGFSSKYIRNSVVPNINALIKFFPTKESLIGFSIDFLRLTPRLATACCLKTNAYIDSVIAEVFGAYNAKRFQFRAKVCFSQNGSDQFMLSGFAVKTQDPKTCFQTYSNTQTINGWIDTAYWWNKETKSIGLFIGGMKNLGSFDKLFRDPATDQPIVFSFNPLIATVFRVAPRFRYIKEPIHVGLELEYTRASYGTLDRYAVPQDARPVGNVRLLFEVLYFF